MKSRSEQFLAIVNGAAGHGRCGRLAPLAIERLRARGASIEVRETHAPEDATRIAREAVREGYLRFIAVGGDGTTFEVINGLASHFDTQEKAERVQLGFLPLGTGNSFLRDFGANRAASAEDAIAQRRQRMCDVMKLTHSTGVLYCINILSFGFVADVCSLANRRFKALGAAGYGLGVVAMLARLKARPACMCLDGGAPWEQPVIFVSFNNSRYTGGGMMMAPYADTADGELDVIVCGEMSRATLLETFPKIFSGKHVHHHAVRASRARTIELDQRDPLDLMIDGEVLRLSPRRIEVLPGAIDVFV